MNVYEELGLKTIINASDTYTRIGGSRMSESVLAAMCDASKYFVDIAELGNRACDAIARMTHNEAAFISSGAGAL
jgi:L-seryl-tRNA(Ser) seleniumtransferase